MKQLKVGAAKIDITPHIGIELAGYTPRIENTNRSTGVHDYLWIRAIALASNNSYVLLLVMDLLGIELPTTQRIRTLITKNIPIASEGILICCTHNHSGPNILENHEKHVRVDQNWKESAIEAAVRVSIMAFDNMRLAQIGVAKTEVCGVGANRKVWLDDGSIFHFMGLNARVPPKGRTVVKQSIIDPELSVLCVKDMDDQIITVLINYACHPWIYNGNRISSEISGACVELVENRLKLKNPNIVALFTPGTGSNITTIQNQMPIPEDLREREIWYTAERVRLGDIFAQAALKAVKKINEFARGGSIVSKIYKITFPIYDRKLEAVLAKYGRLIPTNMTMDTEVQVIQIGQVVLIGLPSEVYVEYGLEIKRLSRYKDTIVISYSNDYFADIITHEAVKEGCCPELNWTCVHPQIRDHIMKCLSHQVLSQSVAK